jgi:anti-sigma factor RsiW
VRLVYKDAAGREITLLQQRDGAQADEATPALIVSPSGLRAYRWTDGEYVLTLAGALSADSLRTLADRVR